MFENLLFKNLKNKSREAFHRNIHNILETKVRHRKIDFFWILFLFFLMLAITFAVYKTGGTNSYVHLLYIPMILSVFLLGMRTAILFAIIAGLLVGPYMPYDVKNQIMQAPLSWMIRLFMFIVVVSTVGSLVRYIKNSKGLEILRANEDIFTGYPNFNKWKSDMQEATLKKKSVKINLIMLELENMETINRNVGYEAGRLSYLKLMEASGAYFEGASIYAIYPNKILVMLVGDTAVSSYNMAKEFIELSKNPYNIDGIPLAFILKGGFIGCEGEQNINLIFTRLGKALELACHSQKDIVIFDSKIDLDSQEYYETLVSIYNAAKENAFYMVYQPKLHGKEGTFVGAEALLRWNNDKYKGIPISKVVKIAEDAGFISQISKWVVREVLKQQAEWMNMGVHVPVAINLSSRDLNDDSIISFLKNCLEEFQVPPSLIEFELTERSIIEDEDTVFSILRELKHLGVRISLDDYGTGHNSLMYLAKKMFHFDYIKIDKMFIDEIENTNTKILIEGIIKSAHGIGIKVVGEGVETSIQADVLKTIDCDVLQGYLYSRPLGADKILDFIKSTVEV